MIQFRSWFFPMALALLVSLPGLAATDYLKEVPKSGKLRYGEIVYVDDGTCPKDEVKEVTGGSREKSIPRKVRCLKRPSSSRKYTP
ncbi:MAG: hypothetical protein OEP48_06745 [Betaproteobacteria bacterium]|nr:hypothetical protein [Betaproteobacteria bacterium]MDH3436161.1 hypothetical protein [Betaproteobacteria bacterium]